MRYLLHQSITRGAERDPGHPAIRCRNDQRTYGELEVASNRLARALFDRGVRRGDRVGIYAKKCVELAVAIHGISKAGAAYVPLDPSAPPERLQRILQSCAIRHLITHEAKRRDLRKLLALQTPVTFCLGVQAGDDLAADAISWDELAQVPEAPPSPGTTEHDLAYVLFTSGSTGEPKGIMHTHRSALAFAEVAARTYGLQPDDRVSNHAPLHFDLSTLDFFSTAVAGATTLVIPEEYTIVPASLSELMERERLTVLYCVPLALIQLLRQGALEQRDLSALRWILFGGEPFPVKHLRSLMEALPHVRFSNVYGPTEVNGCTYYLVPPLPPESDEPIPIGGLYDNVEALVVDDSDRELGTNEPGELLIRSGTRMAGYWGRPDLTAEATFVRATPGGALDLFHRTGDLVVRQPDGDFRFLGRLDRQIKTRGHRVELDEVEAVLLSLDGVEEAAAYALPDGQGSQGIEACVRLGDPRNALSEREIDGHARRHLPPYAVPVRIRILDTFPRTTTGKIDRRQLREHALAALAGSDTRRGEE